MDFRLILLIFKISISVGVGSNVTGGNGRPTVGPDGRPNQIVTSTVLTARDNFMRRSSRTSFTEAEVSLHSHLSWLTFESSKSG